MVDVAMNIDEELNKVLLLHQERNQIIEHIHTCRYKKVGEYHLEISPDERTATIAKTNKVYDAKIAAVYTQINKELSEAGSPLLKNPFERKEIKNEIGTGKED